MANWERKPEISQQSIFFRSRKSFLCSSLFAVLVCASVSSSAAAIYDGLIPLFPGLVLDSSLFPSPTYCTSNASSAQCLSACAQSSDCKLVFVSLSSRECCIYPGWFDGSTTNSSWQGFISPAALGFAQISSGLDYYESSVVIDTLSSSSVNPIYCMQACLTHPDCVLVQFHSSMLCYLFSMYGTGDPSSEIVAYLNTQHAYTSFPSSYAIGGTRQQCISSGPYANSTGSCKALCFSTADCVANHFNGSSCCTYSSLGTISSSPGTQMYFNLRSFSFVKISTGHSLPNSSINALNFSGAEAWQCLEACHQRPSLCVAVVVLSTGSCIGQSSLNTATVVADTVDVYLRVTYGFVKLFQDVQWDGSDIQILPLDQEICIASCQADSNCVAVQMDYVANQCSKKSEFGSGDYNSSATGFSVYIDSMAYGFAALPWDHEFANNPYSVQSASLDPFRCFSLCMQDYVCVGVTFDTTGVSPCSLFSSITTKSPVELVNYRGFVKATHEVSPPLP